MMQMDEMKMMMDMFGWMMMRMRIRRRMLMMIVSIDATIDIVDFFAFSMILDTYCYFCDDPSSYYILGHFDLYGGFMLTYKHWLLLSILNFLDMDIKKKLSLYWSFQFKYCRRSKSISRLKG